jgi:RNA polymerase sigma factor (sigma-70 family)
MTAQDANHRISDWFRQWRSPMRRFLLGRVGVPAADVDDVAQEVFLRLLRYDKADLVEHPQAYVFKVASNVAAEWSIRSRRQRPHDDKWLGSLIGTEQPELQVLLAQLQREIGRGLNTLSPRQREVLHLFFAESLTHEEIAVRLGETLRSVRRQFAKSYEKLRHELDPELLGVVNHGRD